MQNSFSIQACWPAYNMQLGTLPCPWQILEFLRCLSNPSLWGACRCHYCWWTHSFHVDATPILHPPKQKTAWWSRIWRKVERVVSSMREWHWMPSTSELRLDNLKRCAMVWKSLALLFILIVYFFGSRMSFYMVSCIAPPPMFSTTCKASAMVQRCHVWQDYMYVSNWSVHLWILLLHHHQWKVEWRMIRCLIQRSKLQNGIAFE